MTNIATMIASLGRAPRVLFIASSFPPAILPGSPRTWNIATHLGELGWDVTVATIDASQWLRTEGRESVAAELAQRGIRRIDIRNERPYLQSDLLRLPRYFPRLGARIAGRLSRYAHIDSQSGWARGLERRAAQFRRGDFDVLLVSAPPFVMLPVAMRIAERLGCPYVLDYRDLWTLNPMRDSVTEREHRLEAETTRRASAITIISPSSAHELAERFGVGDKLHVVTNGFDSRHFRTVVPAEFDHFAIVYAGSFYLPKRPVTPLVRALALLHARGSIARPWRFHYYGTQTVHVQEEAAAAGLPPERLVLHGAVPRSEALSATAGAGLVTVITTIDSETTTAERGVVTGKIFEAIGLQRQMLVIAPHGSDVEEIVQSAGRGRVVPGKELEQIAAAIAATASGIDIPANAPENHDWVTLAPRLSAVLLDAVAKGEKQ